MSITIQKISASDTWALRHRVMWPEKPIDYIKLADDDQGIHFGLFKEDRLISVVSLFIEDNIAQFRKFATDHAEQGHGYGTKLLSYMIKAAGDSGSQIIWCNARLDKSSFYKRFGMTETDQKFNKDGVEYVIMEKTIF